MNKLISFINDELAETWEEKSEQQDWEVLRGQKESWRSGEIHEDLLLLTAGVDVQENRIGIEVIGWGKRFEHWSVEYHVFNANHATNSLNDRCWEELAMLMTKQWMHQPVKFSIFRESVSMPGIIPKRCIISAGAIHRIGFWQFRDLIG